MAIDADEFRAALGSWPSGVTIITARAGDEIHGMTVSDFSGASLDPPLALVCASKTSVTTGLIEKGGCFGVNVLQADQSALSNKFASKKDEFRRFEGVATWEATTGAPLLEEALVNLDCRLVALHDAGDHILCVGEIEQSRVREGEPLLFFKGTYGRFEAETR
ncbi:MAG: flavin reductase family protein [Deltaproteobacteria bacterium]|jgi:flavin reductase (DIM6/NTAB) family NADH-FMN oxidoreductase RutF|nr:flavin reductase family protein [Deltaproteobacteria bacterium]